MSWVRHSSLKSSTCSGDAKRCKSLLLLTKWKYLFCFSRMSATFNSSSPKALTVKMATCFLSIRLLLAAEETIGVQYLWNSCSSVLEWQSFERLLAQLSYWSLLWWSNSNIGHFWAIGKCLRSFYMRHSELIGLESPVTWPSLVFWVLPTFLDRPLWVHAT